MSIKVEKITEPVLLGEGPHWDDRQQCLYYVSIYENAIHKYVPDIRRHTKTTLEIPTIAQLQNFILDGRVGFMVPIEDTTDQFLVGVERKFLVVRWDGEEGSEVTVLKELGEVDHDTPDSRINDGKVDPSGRLFAGTMGPEDFPGNYQPVSSLYRLDSAKGCKIEKVISGVTLSNGLAWDVEDKAFYYIDTMEKKIRRYDYDIETGELSNLKYVFDFEKHNIKGLPDGMTIDTDGNLWVAAVTASCVLKINPKTGEILLNVPIPALFVTSVTFGGPCFDTLFVTTANIGEKQLPPAGSTFTVTGLGVKGHPNKKFKL